MGAASDSPCLSAEDSIAAKILSYNRANRAVAILCNHQRATSSTFEKSIQNLQTKVAAPRRAPSPALQGPLPDSRSLGTGRGASRGGHGGCGRVWAQRLVQDGEGQPCLDPFPADPGEEGAGG